MVFCLRYLCQFGFGIATFRWFMVLVECKTLGFSSKAIVRRKMLGICWIWKRSWRWSKQWDREWRGVCVVARWKWRRRWSPPTAHHLTNPIFERQWVCVVSPAHCHTATLSAPTTPHKYAATTGPRPPLLTYYYKYAPDPPCGTHQTHLVGPTRPTWTPYNARRLQCENHTVRSVWRIIVVTSGLVPCA